MSRVITRDASDLGWEPGEVGLAVFVEGRNHEYHHLARDQEGEVMYWEYHPTTDQAPETIVRVFND
jgi:hypothetical protein